MDDDDARSGHICRDALRNQIRALATQLRGSDHGMEIWSFAVERNAGSQAIQARLIASPGMLLNAGRLMLEIRS